jgi:hypothetical protein
MSAMYDSWVLQQLTAASYCQSLNHNTAKHSRLHRPPSWATHLLYIPTVKKHSHSHYLALWNCNIFAINVSVPHLALLIGFRKTEHEVKQHWVTQKGKRSETKISNIILHYRGFRQERYSETALSEVYCSEGYLYSGFFFVKNVTTSKLCLTILMYF